MYVTCRCEVKESGKAPTWVVSDDYPLFNIICPGGNYHSLNRSELEALGEAIRVMLEIADVRTVEENKR
jgi:hypothetical protein